MRKTTIRVLALALTLGVGALTIHAAKVGDPAPTFTATDTTGKVHTLSALKGKWVVLEWHNNGCPYVRRHYAGNIQKLQHDWTAKGVVWFTVISSAPGLQGHVTAAEANAYAKAVKAAPTAILLDPKGDLGSRYEARTTPHMFVINPRGILVYNGAIDNKPSTDPADDAAVTNYVSAALTEGMAGKPITTPTSRPYGCSVKYAPAK
jgi:alkyl hydroperoxide reductase subunit AhpC